MRVKVLSSTDVWYWWSEVWCFTEIRSSVYLFTFIL